MKKTAYTSLLATTALLLACSDGSDNNNDNGGNPTPPEPEPVACSGTEVNPERLFLQQLGSDRVIIKWRGNLDGGEEADRVCFGTDMNLLLEETETAATVTTTGHSEVLLTGLTPETTFYYSVGGAGWRRVIFALRRRQDRYPPMATLGSGSSAIPATAVRINRRRSNRCGMVSMPLWKAAAANPQTCS